MWVTPSKRECYLRRFPDFLNGERVGQVFSLRNTSKGSRRLDVNQKEWERCQDCHYYRHCYDLGTAILQLMNWREAERSAKQSVSVVPTCTQWEEED